MKNEEEKDIMVFVAYTYVFLLGIGSLCLIFL